MPARRTASRTTSAPSSVALKILQAAEKLAGRRANGADDDGLTHDESSRVRRFGGLPLGDDDFDARHDVGAEQFVHARRAESGRA